MKKRITSLVLALVILISFIPVASAGQVKSRAIEYIFSRSAYKDASGNVYAKNIALKNAVGIAQSSMADGYSKWNIEGVSQVRDGSAIQDGALYIYGSTNRVTDAGTNTIATAIVLDVTETGTFTPKLTYTGLPNSPKYKVYFAKKKTGDDVSGWCNGSKHNSNNAKLNAYIATLTDAEYLGEVDTYWQTSTANMSKELKEINITEEGAYYLILADNGISSSAGTITEVQTYINSFSLVPPSSGEIEDELIAFTLSASSNTMFAGEAVTLTATAEYSESGKKILSEGVTYKSSDENVATVSDDGKVLGKNEGTTTITATVDGTEMSDSVDIEVKVIKQASGDYVYKFDRTAYASEENVARAELAKKALSDVDTDVSYPWRPAGTRYLTNVYSDNDGIYWTAATSRAVSKIACLALELAVFEEARYVPVLEYKTMPNAPIVDVYLVKEGTVITAEIDGKEYSPASFIFAPEGNNHIALYHFVNNLGDEYRLKTVDMYGKKSEFKSVALPAQTLDSDSKYYLIFRAVGTNPNFDGANLAMQVRSLTLGGPVLGELAISSETPYVLINDTDGMKLSLSAKMTDGKPADISGESGAVITYKSSDSSIATVDENGVVMPVGLGNVTVTATVRLGKITLSKDIRLVVSSVPVAEGLKIALEDIKPSQSGDITVNFTTDTAGNYDVIMSAFQATYCGLARFYIDGRYIGEFDGYADAENLYSPVPKLGRSIAIPAGEHTLLVKKGGTTSGTDDEILIESVELISTENLCGISEVKIELERKTLAPGETSDYSVKIVQENGAEYYAPISSSDGTVEAAFALIPFENDIVSVSPGRIKAVSPGTVRLRVTETFNGFDASGAAVLYIEDAAYESAEINLDESVLYFVGGKKKLEASAVLSNGRAAAERDIAVGKFASDNEAVVKIENGEMAVIDEGEATVSVDVTFNNITKTASKKIRAEKAKLTSISAKTEDTIISVLDADGSRIIVTGINNDGSTVDLSGSMFTYESLNPEYFTVDDDGYAHFVSRGAGKVKVTADVAGSLFECEADVVSGSGKTEPTIYNYEMRRNALNNAKKYDWAKRLQKSAVEKADKWIENLDVLYAAVPGEGLPRSSTMGTVKSPTEATETTPAMQYNCPYCGVDIRTTTGAYSWGMDLINRPWKVQCTTCKREFPSNDFEAFYELGVDKATGIFSRETALMRHRELFGDLSIETPGAHGSEQWKAYYGYGNENGYLCNKIYSEKDSMWMVDDGFGWSPRDGVPGSSEKVSTNPKWCPIAVYMHKFWGLTEGVSATQTIVGQVFSSLRDAYLYTGDPKYGRAGAILLDRIADVYPHYDVTKTSMSYTLSHGGRNAGKTVGTIWEPVVGNFLITSYDAFYPMMDDPEVISYLSEKAREYGIANPKTNGDYIKENAETGIIREVMKGLYEDKIDGNFGKAEYTGTIAAVALDTYPESGEMFRWLVSPSVIETKSIKDPIYPEQSYTTYVSRSGGELMSKYVTDVDRDGFGNEVASGYNSIWTTETIAIAEVVSRYSKETGINLFENPKYIKMFDSVIRETVGNGYTLSLGDGGATAGVGLNSTAPETLQAFNLLDKDDKNRIWLAKNYYYSVGGDLKDIYVDIFTDNSKLAGEIQDIIDEYGELKFESENLTGFGLALLRRGELVKSSGAVADVDYRGDVWMYYGRTNVSHSHLDMLQLGLNAYGFNFTPDLGYPEATSYDENRWQWNRNTLSHNAVVVNDEYQDRIYDGTPLHFDSTDRVGIIDVEAPDAYEETSIYRRTAVSVAASDEVSYTIDFFRIKGGDKHTYSFHTQSYMGYSTEDFELIPQVDEDGNYVGTYAGADVPYGPDPDGNNKNSNYVCRYPRGYTWLENVNRAAELADGNFSVNFKQTDFNKQVADSSGLNLKFTALNDWTPSEVAITTGYAPRTSSNKNVKGLDYMFIHREGDNLDTLYTSVLQPYKGEEYIESIESVTLTVNGTDVTDNSAKAIKVILKNGRTDYIVYSTDSNVLYEVDGKFSFRGFVGVYSLNENGENIYAYVNDGDVIGEINGTDRYVGEIVSFTEELTDKNTITVQIDGEVDLENLAGRYIYVANDGVQNGAYRILNASANAGNSLYTDLHLGNTSVICGYKNDTDFDEGYIYNIEKGQNFTIPLSTVEDFAPDFDAVSENITTSAGNSITVKVTAISPKNENITYIGTNLPRGALLDEATGTVTWKPTASQIGESGFMITARDESGRERSVKFDITVYGSTSGGGSSGQGSAGGSDSTDSSDTAGSGSSDTPTDGKDNVTDSTDSKDNTETDNNTESETPSTENGGATGNKEGFVDLDSHAWAEDAINSLAEAGIIKGTSESTFSPAANITRADFAILLVRAFELESENAENFADVDASDYFARELAIARNTGIVGGIGDNKYAPRNTITRQDMMVIVYRALGSLPLEGKVAAELTDEVLSQYPDFESVAEYARDAVRALISAGLVNGKSGMIAATEYTTRAEVAVLLKRILDYTGR